MPHSALIEKMAGFAQTHVRPRPELGTRDEFPHDIWAAMGEQGLLDPCRMVAGRWGPVPAITGGGRALAASGGNLGLALSWMIHHLVAGVLLKPCLDDPDGNNVPGKALHKPGLWNRIRRGKSTVALAVSEPEAGAHPKFMTANAEKTAQGFRVSGEKTHVTNGPVADAFVVIAVTGQAGPKKQFSAFLVDRDCPGLEVSGPMAIPFFKPAPHAGLSLDGCCLDQTRCLGTEGAAFPDMVLPFRRLEDAVMTGPVTGAMMFILDALAQHMSRSQGDSPEQDAALGNLWALTETAVYLSGQMAGMADRECRSIGSFLSDASLFEAMLLYFRQMAAQYLDGLSRLLSETGVSLDSPADILVRDLESSSRLGEKTARLRSGKLGRLLLMNTSHKF
ncbi:MAG: acyl-CoA dehydrogenase family protein [Desulfobacter sp.]